LPRSSLLLLLLALLCPAAGAADAAPQDLALRFAKGLELERMDAFCPLVASRAVLAGQGWQGVRDLFESMHGIAIRRVHAVEGGEPLLLRVEIDGSGISRNERQEPVALPAVWWLTLARQNGELFLVSAETEAVRVAGRLVATVDREGLLRESVAGDAEIARALFRHHFPFDRHGQVAAAAEWLRDRARLRSDAATEMYALARLSRLARSAADPERALRLMDEWLAVPHPGLAPEVRTAALLEAAESAAFSDPDRARRSWEEAADSVPRLRDVNLIVDAVAARAISEFEHVQMAEARLSIARLQKSSERWGWDRGRLLSESLMGMTYRALHEDSAALGHFLTLADLASAAIEDVDFAQALFWAARSEARLHDLVATKRLLETGLKAIPADEANTRLGLKAEQLLLNVEAASSEDAAELEQLIPRVDDPSLRRNAWQALEKIRRNQGHYADAAYAARQSLREGAPLILWLAWATMWYLAEDLVALGQIDEALANYRQAIELIEARRMLIPLTRKAALRYFSDKWESYHRPASLLARLGRNREALDLLERGRTQVLGDVLQDPGGEAPLTAEELVHRRQLEERVVAVTRTLVTAPDTAAADRARDALATARVARDSFEDELALAHPETAFRHAVVPGGPRSSPHRGTAFLEYVVDKDHLLLLVVTRGGNGETLIRSRSIAIPADELRAQVRRFATAVSTGNLDYRSDARKLGALLLGPARPLLRGITHLCIVPDDVLWLLPFQALRLGGRMVIADYAVSYTPSMSTLQLSESRAHATGPPRSLLALGDPRVPREATTAPLAPLPDAEREVRDIAKLYRRSAVYTGAQAAESTVTARAAEFDVLHFAAHGRFDPDDAMYSAIFLSQGAAGEDGRLEAHEVSRLHLRARLAVLSGCDTGKGSLNPGEGLVGMSWAFLVAGCPTTVATQWEAASESARRLMVGFHRRLQQGKSPAEALRLAELSLLRDPRFAHPYFWAPFVVVGAGG
jgi:CHAT domain-containing protein/tetratricopeptide (TPR) repeat protein